MSELWSIPTVYKGIRFRSRLEARWAALFDAMSWPWTYEPFDLDGWVPDFEATIDGVVRLVEVKPARSLDELREHVTAGRQLAAAPDGTLALGARPFGDAVGLVVHVARSLKRSALAEDRSLLRAIEVAHEARRVARVRPLNVEKAAKACGLTLVREVAVEPLIIDRTKLHAAWPEASNATQFKPPRKAAAPDVEVCSAEETAAMAGAVLAMLKRKRSA